MDTQAAANADTKGHSDFVVIYDDTGADVTISAPAGWKIRKVIEEAYDRLGETPRPGDRVEADGTDLAPYLDLRVKEFIEQGIAPDLTFNIISATGGASIRGRS